MKESTAVEVLNASEWRCGLATFQGGRCARAVPSAPGDHNTPLHHIIYKSRGGGDTPGNLLALCAHHHDSIHDGNRPLLEDDHGRYYQFDVGPRDQIEWEKWHLWEDVRETFESAERAINADLLAAAKGLSLSLYDVSWCAAQIESMGLYELAGYDDAKEYVMGEAGLSDSAARNALRVGRNLLAHPEHRQIAKERGLFFTAYRNALPAMRGREDADQIVFDMCDAQDAGVPVEGIVESVREATGHASQEAEYEVSARFKATDATLTLRVSARNADAAHDAFRRAAGITGRLDGIVSVEVSRVRRVT